MMRCTCKRSLGQVGAILPCFFLVLEDALHCCRLLQVVPGVWVVFGKTFPLRFAVCSGFTCDEH